MPDPDILSPTVIDKARTTILRAQATIRRCRELLRVSREVQADRDDRERCKALLRARKAEITNLCDHYSVDLQTLS